jgi:hypothetical protein
VGGVFSRNLSNGGDVFEIVDGLENPVLSVAYDDGPPWPVGADGWGYSLVPVDPQAEADPNDGASWRVSTETGGSPGRDDGPPIEPATPFRRGDTNADGRVNVADGINILRHLFAEGPELSCRDAADANDDGTVDVADTIRLLGHLFGGLGAPPDPYLSCGEDETADTLDCAVFRPCE